MTSRADPGKVHAWGAGIEWVAQKWVDKIASHLLLKAANRYVKALLVYPLTPSHYIVY